MSRRKNSRTPEEMSILINLVSRHVHEVECAHVRFGDVRKRQATAWASITREFNASRKITCQASQKELRALWSVIKAKAKRHRKKVGRTAPLQDWLAATTEKILQKAEEARTPTRSPFQTPPHPAAGDSATEFGSPQKEATGNLNSSDPPSVEERPASPSSTAVSYCPRKQFVTPGRKVSSSLEERDLSTPDSHPGPSCSPVADPYTQSRKPSQIVQKTFPPNVLPGFQRIVPGIPLPPNVPTFYNGINTSRPNFYQGPRINTMWTSGNLPSSVQTQQQQVPGIQSTLRPRPPSTVLEDNFRTQNLQFAQTQLHIRHIESLAAMEKTLHENKMRTEEVTRSLARTLHNAQMKTNSATSESQRVIQETLLKREEEFHQARMRTEEESLSMQKELHDIKMETVKLELHEAEIARQIVTKKLELVELELEQLKESGWYSPRTRGS